MSIIYCLQKNYGKKFHWFFHLKTFFFNLTVKWVDEWILSNSASVHSKICHVMQYILTQIFSFFIAIGAQGIIIVYDVTDRETFDNVRTWITEIEKYSQAGVCKILVGNKCDMEDRR